MSSADTATLTRCEAPSMSCASETAPFLLYVVDWDRQEFTVEGPMTDHTRWMSAVEASRNAGRSISCMVGGEGDTPREHAARDWQMTFAHSFVSPGSIVS